MPDVFVCDLVVAIKVYAIKVYQGDLYNMYLEQISNFIVDKFWAFKSLLECKHENIHMKWIVNFNSGFQHLAFEVNGQHIWAMHHDLETMTLHLSLNLYLLLLNQWWKTSPKVNS